MVKQVRGIGSLGRVWRITDPLSEHKNAQVAPVGRSKMYVGPRRYTGRLPYQLIYCRTLTMTYYRPLR